MQATVGLSTTQRQVTDVELACKLFPHLRREIKYWNKRLRRKYPMALTKDVDMGRVNKDNYHEVQEGFANVVVDWSVEEILLARTFFGDDEELNFEDVGAVGEGRVLRKLVKEVIAARMRYRGWEFTETGIEIGNNIVEEVFGDVSKNIPAFVRFLIQRGVLQLLFHDDPQYHKIIRYAVLLMSRVLQDQHDPADVDMILRNIPLQAMPGGRAIIVTIFEENNSEVDYTNSALTKREDFLHKINARSPAGQHWDVMREMNFVVGPEVYTILTIADPTLVGYQYPTYGLRGGP